MTEYLPAQTGVRASRWAAAMPLAACLLAPPAFAQTSVSEFVTHPVIQKFRTLLRDEAASQAPMAPNTTPAQALARAWKRGFIEEGIEETKNTLLQCQRETSVVLTTPLMRSDAQQAHYGRF